MSRDPVSNFHTPPLEFPGRLKLLEGTRRDGRRLGAQGVRCAFPFGLYLTSRDGGGPATL